MKTKRDTQPIFSFYKRPVTNVIPYKNITLADAYRVISGKYLKGKTLKLRSISDKHRNRKFKSANFPYCTFSGVFTKRNESSLIRHSGLIAIDFDHLENVRAVKDKLLKDPCLRTELLFVSPNGEGLKWIINIDIENYSHSDYSQSVYNYRKETYCIEIEKSCRDVARASFLCYDPDAFINPKHLVE